MAAMRRGLLHVAAWSLATGAATTLSWWGVHAVLAGTAHDPPRALPVTATEPSARASRSSASSTFRPAPSSSPVPSPAHTPGASPGRSAPAAPGPATSPARPSATPSRRIRSYDTAGGRVVFDLGASSASLVSAAPKAGWSMQVWKTPSWIRVEFGSGADRVSVFCIWHDGPPRVQVGTY